MALAVFWLEGRSDAAHMPAASQLQFSADNLHIWTCKSPYHRLRGSGGVARLGVGCEVVLSGRTFDNLTNGRICEDYFTPTDHRTLEHSMNRSVVKHSFCLNIEPE